MKPLTPYGVAKAAATNLVDTYRAVYGIFACSGIAYNHESPLRPDNYAIKRIVNGAVDILQKRSDRLYLGNCSIVRDWGWAPDYVECFWKLLQHKDPQNFVIATGIGTSLEEIVDRVFKRCRLNWKQYVKIDKSLMRPKDIQISIGNPARVQSELGWTARVRMPEVADRLIDAAVAGNTPIGL